MTPRPRSSMAGQDGERRRHRGKEVDVEGVPEVALGDLHQTDAGILCGVVDQQVDGSVGRRHVGEDVPQGTSVGDVAGDRARLRREGAQVGRQLVQPLRVAGQADHDGAGAGQVHRQLGTQPC